MELKLKKILTVVSLILLLATPVFATDYTSDANCMGAFLMEDSGNETDAAQGNTLIETSGTIPQNGTDYKFGSYSRDFERGDSEYLTHADALDTDISGVDQELSLVVWAKWEAGNNAYNPLIAKWDDSTSNEQYFLGINDYSGDALSFRVTADGSTAVTCVGGTNLDTGSWQHFAAVYDDTDMRVYVDGTLDSNGSDNPKSHTGGIADTSSPFYIGTYFRLGSPNKYWDGLLDDAGVFDRDLSSVEVNDIMDNGLQQAAAASILSPMICIF